MTIPNPSATFPTPEHWGFITSYHDWSPGAEYDKYWFTSKDDMFRFLCFGSSKYLRPPLEDESPLEVMYLQISKAQTAREEVDALDSIIGTWVGNLQLIWIGQFDQMLVGNHPFAIKLRGHYSERLGTFGGGRPIFDEDDIADFCYWLHDFGGFEKSRRGL
jgi:hypothetical protein